jgi:RHS repeat-associated protein
MGTSFNIKNISKENTFLINFFKIRKLSALCFTWLWLVFLGSLTLHFMVFNIPLAHADTSGPGWFNVYGQAITPEKAAAYYAPKREETTIAATALVMEESSAEEITTEINELARGLNHNPKLIYEYVRNHVDYVPYYGSLKGATLTYLDGSGNDFDQASLMIALLRASGYDAQYIYGVLSIPASGASAQKDMQHWLGVTDDNTVISNILAYGGIPHTSGTEYEVARVWISATIDGTNYVFDPAFKVYETVSGINLVNTMGYNQETLRSTAGGIVDTGGNYVQGIDEDALGAQLTSYSTTLFNAIRANYPNASMEEIVGGREIIPEYLTELPSSLEFAVVSQETPWDNIPDEYAHTIKIQHGEINTDNLNIAKLAGKKLSISYTDLTSEFSSVLNSQALLAPVNKELETDIELRQASLPWPDEDDPVVTPNTAHGPISFGSISPDDTTTTVCGDDLLSFSNDQTVSGAILHITISLVNNSSNAFSITSGSGTHNLTIGESVTVDACFSATGQSYGTKTAQIKIVYYFSVGSYSTETVTDYYGLTGTVVHMPDLDGSYGHLFGSVALNNPEQGTCRIFNNGSLDLIITGVSLDGDDKAHFDLVDGTGTGTLEEGEYRDITVQYLADSLGSHSANVLVEYTYDGAARGVYLPLTAEAIIPPTAQLWLDDELIIEESDPSSASGLGTMTLTIEHPYPDETIRTGARQEVAFPMKRGENYYTIIYDFGSVQNSRLLEKRQRQLKSYRLSGNGDDSRQVITESLNIMGMTWMRDTALNSDLLDELSNSVSIYHHRVGVVAQEAGYYIDVKAQKSSNLIRSNDSETHEARLRAVNFMESAMEHGVLEQMQINRPAVSTVKLFQATNEDGDPVFLVDSDNFDSIKPQLAYDTDELDFFEELVIDNGYTLILPANGSIALESGSDSGWAGKGYIRYKNENNALSCHMIIDGDHYGGFAVMQGTVDGGVVDQKVTSNIQQPVTQAETLVGEPVDMTTGYWVFNQTDLALSGEAGGLAFKRSYFSGNHQIESKLGYGWSHNYDLYADVQSNTPYGIGQRLPTDSTALLVASVAIIHLMDGDIDIKDWMVAALVGKWGMDQLTDNAVELHMDSSILTYIKQPDGTYSLPPDINAELILENGQYRLEDRFDQVTRFDTENRVSTITDADGNTVTFTYSGDNLDAVADEFGHSLSFAYTDELLSSVTDSQGRIISFDYTGDNLTTYTDPENKAWDYGYDDDHRVLSLEDPNGITTITNVYDSFGRVTTQTAPRQSGIATYNYYFSEYRNVQEEAGHDIRTVYYYDRKKRLVATENALGNKTSHVYDAQNHVVQTTDPRGNITLYEYDGNNNLVRVTDALGNETVNTYDDDFHLTDETDPLGNLVHYDYNSKHHLIKTTVYPDSGQTIETSVVYDDETGLKVEDTDGRGILTTLDYDSYGNLDFSQTASAPAINYDYNGIGLMTSLTDQKSQITSYSYDNRGLLETRTDPLGQSMSLTYYDDGKIESITDRNSYTVTYTYTDAGKVETVSFPDGTSTSYEYNSRDNLIKMEDSTGITEFAYDVLNRLTSRTDANGFTVAYTYDEAGNLATLTYPGSKTVTYTYDALNRLETVTDWLDRTATYHYDEAGRLDALTQFNGTVVEYSYDNANRLTGLANLTVTGGSTIATYSFTLDGNGNRTSISQEIPLNVSLSSTTTNYTIGNANRLTSDGPNAFTYDNEGQLATAYGNTLAFDYEHRLTGISGSDEFQYTYDGAGNRISAVRNGTQTLYIYDASGNLLAEADSEGVTRYYIYGTGLLAMADTSGTMYCYHFDATGHTVAVTDNSKTIVNAYAYTPFGILASKEEIIEQPFKFVGQFGVMTEDNGWYYMRARYYDPEMGRFISEDPLGFDGGDVNLYAYALNNPVMFIDPLGLCSETNAVAILAADYIVSGPGGTVATVAGVASLVGAIVLAMPSDLADGTLPPGYLAEHSKNKRQSNKNKHEKGQKRKNQKNTDKKRNHSNWKPFN